MEKQQFNGQCAFAMSLGKTAPGSEKHRITRGSDIYLFSNPIAKPLWKIIPGRQKKAQANWQQRQ